MIIIVIYFKNKYKKINKFNIQAISKSKQETALNYVQKKNNL